jgi:acetone carboxylase gamma subunit
MDTIFSFPHKIKHNSSVHLGTNKWKMPLLICFICPTTLMMNFKQSMSTYCFTCVQIFVEFVSLLQHKFCEFFENIILLNYVNLWIINLSLLHIIVCSLIYPFFDYRFDFSANLTIALLNTSSCIYINKSVQETITDQLRVPQ